MFNKICWNYWSTNIKALRTRAGIAHKSAHQITNFSSNACNEIIYGQTEIKLCFFITQSKTIFNFGRTRYDTDSCISFLLNQCGCSIDHWWSADMDIVIYLSRSEMIIFFGSKFSDFCQRYGLFCMMEWSAILALMRGHLSQRPLFF